jgi:putative peptidoglycan lipid II flippase
LPAALVAKLWISAAAAAGAAWAVKLGIGHRDPMHRHPIVAAVAILGTYGVLYFAATYAARVEECAGALRRVARLRR